MSLLSQQSAILTNEHQKMAFIQSTTLRLSSFTPSSVEVKPRSSRPSCANIRMSEAKTDSSEPAAVGIAGKSQWKENLFAGGFPGGEAYFKEWIEKGMGGDVPDMPKSMQPSAEFKPTTVPRTGVLATLDKTEFFKDFVGKETEEESAETEEAGAESIAFQTGVEVDEITPDKILETEIPSDEVYGKYFPSHIRNLAPMIDIQYNKSPYDKVGVSMNPVNASYTDVYYPKETKNKAPFLDIFYSGSLATASVRLSLDFVEGLPTLPPPTKSNDATVHLEPGSGGGLKLNFENASGEKLL